MENINDKLNKKNREELDSLIEKIIKKPNRKELDSLIEKIIKEPNEVVVFFGNGVSRLAGSPSWDDLANSLLKSCCKDYKLPYDIYFGLENKHDIDSIEKISIAYEFLKKEFKQDFESNFKGILKEILIPKKENNIKFNRIYEYLSDLQVCYITTNYYTGLYSNTTNSHLNKMFFYDFAHPFMLKGNDIAYIHGEINKSNLSDMVLTLEQYLKKYTKGKDNTLSDFLREIFDKKTVLFIGFGLREYEIIQHLVPSEVGKVKHYLLRNRFEYEEYIDGEYENYYKSLSIKLINYNISKIGYDALEYILVYMSNKVKEGREKIDIYKNKQKKAMLPYIRE